MTFGVDFWTLVLSLWSVSVSQCAGSSGLLTIQKRDQNPTLNREVLCAECVRAMKTNRQWRQARDEKVIAREDCYTYIAAPQSPDLRHTTKREGDTSVTVVTSNDLCDLSVYFSNFVWIIHRAQKHHGPRSTLPASMP